ncbi:MAG: thioredoxin-disulfide reductase [Deltaproteobacteria bacterium]|nr:thioredoxin-disulfide reductase [Deltaproteobacteria bacterium]
MLKDTIRNVVIVGSGPAGYTAAIYAARAGLNPLLFEGLQPGGQLTITTDVENFPGFREPVAGPELMANMRAQAERVGAEIVSDVVESVDLASRPFVIRLSSTEIPTKSLVIATGAEARWLGIPSEQKYRGRGVSACATCDGFFFRNQKVAVIGGGDSACEEANYLTNHASQVVLIHRRDQLRASNIMAERTLGNPKIRPIWFRVLDEVLGDDRGVTGLRLKDPRNGESEQIQVDGVFIAIGHRPNTEFLDGQIELDEKGYIVTAPDSTATSVKGVFAAGDVQDSVFRQAVTAAGTGCMAAIEASHFLEEQGHSH